MKEDLHIKPELDPQALEVIQQILAQSMEDHSAITLTFFDPIEDRSARGIVMSAKAD